MSITEILVVLIVALFVIKPEDMPAIVKGFRKLKRYVSSLQRDIMMTIEEPEDATEMNKYLEKITALGARYDGEYSLDAVRGKYMELLKLPADK
jgi:Sec-independent protein translocase protein TatA